MFYERTASSNLANIHTEKGDITLQLNTSTPKTVENFTLCEKGFYNGTIFIA